MPVTKPLSLNRNADTLIEPGAENLFSSAVTPSSDTKQSKKELVPLIVAAPPGLVDATREK